jgi:hypothetical protein
VKFY